MRPAANIIQQQALQFCRRSASSQQDLHSQVHCFATFVQQLMPHMPHTGTGDKSWGTHRSEAALLLHAVIQVVQLHSLIANPCRRLADALALALLLATHSSSRTCVAVASLPVSAVRLLSYMGRPAYCLHYRQSQMISLLCRSRQYASSVTCSMLSRAQQYQLHAPGGISGGRMLWWAVQTARSAFCICFRSSFMLSCFMLSSFVKRDTRSAQGPAHAAEASVAHAAVGCVMRLGGTYGTASGHQEKCFGTSFRVLLVWSCAEKY